MIEVYRYLGDKQGDPIVEPLIPETMLVERGRYEMDKQAQQINSITCNIAYRGGLKLGQLLAIPDPSSSSMAKAKLTGISLSFTNGSAQQTLTMEKPVLS